MTLRVRWLGQVGYRDSHALQRALHRADGPADQWLLLVEHRPVYTMGISARLDHVLVDPASVGAELVRADRGGDVTYHGPGQLTGYPILDVPVGPGSTHDYVRAVEDLIIEVLDSLGLADIGRLDQYPGVWVGPQSGNPRKICAVGVRLSRGRSMHGFALNVNPDMSMFGHIVPCGISDLAVTSLAAEGVDVSMRTVVDAVATAAIARWGTASGWERADVAWRVDRQDLAAFTRGEGAGDPVASPPVEARPTEQAVGTRPAEQALGTRAAEPAQPVRLLGRLAEAGVDTSAAIGLYERKPAWLRVQARMGPEYRALKKQVRDLDLVTVCEEAGCPNIFECWTDGTATFMINGDRCTRACGFCLVDTRKPLAADPGEPERVAEAVSSMGLDHAVITTVARDDLDDGGAGAFAATIAAIRRRRPRAAIEVLISDCKGDPASLAKIFDARPDILNHNIETVARLQRAVRPSASYARSLSVLARAKAAGLTTKSGIIVGMGETHDEVVGVLADLRGVKVDIVTIGQYLRPTTNHLPVARWWRPEEFSHLKMEGEAMGIAHVEASPLTRSSYHAKQAASAAAGASRDAAEPGMLGAGT